MPESNMISGTGTGMPGSMGCVLVRSYIECLLPKHPLRRKKIVAAKDRLNWRTWPRAIGLGDG